MFLKDETLTFVSYLVVVKKGEKTGKGFYIQLKKVLS
jgi:hypothetical protein